jgi:rhodanese-related sulfurtransferase
MKAIALVIPLASLSLAACASSAIGDAPSATATARSQAPAPASPTIVDARRARELVAAGVTVVDVRTAAEFEAGHIPGAVNIPFDELAARAGELGSPSTPILLYCRSGRRSGIAGETLRRLGFSEQYDLQAYDRWVAFQPGAAGG